MNTASYVYLPFAPSFYALLLFALSLRLYQQQHELAAVVLRFNCPVLNKLRHHFGVSGDSMQKAKKTTNDYKSVKTIVSGENLVFYMK